MRPLLGSRVVTTLWAVAALCLPTRLLASVGNLVPFSSEALQMPWRKLYKCREGSFTNAVKEALQMPWRKLYKCREGSFTNAVKKALQMTWRKLYKCCEGNFTNAVKEALQIPWRKLYKSREGSLTTPVIQICAGCIYKWKIKIFCKILE